jgi:type IV secretion system protein TrbL
MSCDGVNALNPFCQVSKILSQQATDAADSAFTHIAGYFGVAAQAASTWLWGQVSDATTINLRSPALARELAAVGGVAAILCLGLFVIQVITSVLRREPGGLARALRGLVVAFVGASFAILSTQLLITATDALSQGVVQYTMGTNIQGLGSRLAFSSLATVGNPALLLIASLLILIAVVVVWAAMMVRKLTILVAAVAAPLAFSGSVADVTRGWVRRWIELVCAMIASKLLLVIVLSVGVSVLDGAGQVGDGASQVATQLACGCLILMLGGFAPWVAVRMFHFAGDALYAAHAQAAQTAAGAKAAISAPQKMSGMQSQGRYLIHSMTRTSYARGSRTGGAGNASAHRLDLSGGHPPGSLASTVATAGGSSGPLEGSAAQGTGVAAGSSAGGRTPGAAADAATPVILPAVVAAAGVTPPAAARRGVVQPAASGADATESGAREPGPRQGPVPRRRL